MRVPLDLPQIALVRVESAGGPYRPGDRLSLAFVVPTVGRVVAHDGDGVTTAITMGEDVVPETVTVVVDVPAAPYERGERLALAFVDPRVARIHPLLARQTRPHDDDDDDNERADHRARDASTAHATTVDATPPDRSASTRTFASEPDLAYVARTTTLPITDRDERDEPEEREEVERDEAAVARDGRPLRTTRRADADVAVDADATNRTETNDGYRRLPTMSSSHGPVADVSGRATSYVRVRLAWTPDRVRRFVQVVDKLFTVDRLGWYRHTLAMRLLVPDEVTCGDALGDIEAMRHVHALRAAAVETLGRPLLAAFMPNFSVSADWLASLDSAHAARAVVGVRDALLPFATDDAGPPTAEPGYTMRTIRKSDLSLGAASVEGSIAALVPTISTSAMLTACLDAYRSTLVDVFGQTARAAEAVRINGMTQPNHSLDDRLWQLVGAVGEAFDGLAVA